MKKITVFGNEYSIIRQEKDKNKVEFRQDQILVNAKDTSEGTLLQDFLSDLLFNKALDISEIIKKEGKIDLLGTLDFEITKQIDNKKNRIAKLKGNKIILKQDLISLPENLIKYIIAHEMAHISNKKHTERFWKTVELICPNYKNAKNKLLMLNPQNEN